MPYKTWKRYLSFFDELTVIARRKKLKEYEKLQTLSLSSGKSVNFKLLDSISSSKKKLLKIIKIRKMLYQEIHEAEAVIARVPSELGFLAIDIAKRKNKPYAVEVVADTWSAYWNYGSLLGKLYAPIATYRTKKKVLKAPFAIYVTKYFLQNKYPCKGKVGSASNVEIPPPDKRVLEYRINKIKKYYNGQHNLKIGLIASLATKNKGIDTALIALAKIKNKIPNNFEFHILGDGSADYWVELARELGLSNHVYFDGVLPGGGAVYGWLDNIDIYIHPSRQEGLPRAVIEAMSRGCPVIGSCVAGIPELLNRDVMHKPGNSKFLSRLIERAIKDEKWQLEQARYNFDTVKKYAKDNLDRERDDFWKCFYDFVNEKESYTN